MKCPRCGAENADSRAACWSCLAQLHRSDSEKLRKVDVKPTPIPTEEIVAVPPALVEETVMAEDIAPAEFPPLEPELEPVPEADPLVIEEIPSSEPEQVAAIPEPEQPEEMSVFGSDSFGVTAEAEPEASKSVIEIHEIGPSEDADAGPAEEQPDEDEPALGRVLDLDSESGETGGIVPGLAYDTPEEEDAPVPPAEEDARGVFDLDTSDDEPESPSDDEQDA